MKEYGIFNKIAVIASIILWSFIIFCSGLWFAQTESFVQAEQDYFTGVAQAELLPYAKDSFDKQLTVWQDAPHALQGGALLIGSHFTDNPALLLVDEDGKILHSWNVEKRLFNNEILRWWQEPLALDVFAIDDAHLLPGGDVIFTQDLRDLQNFRGQRLARMDVNSKIKWQVAGTFHHEFNIGGNPQKIYVMTSAMRDELPVIGPKLENVRYLEDGISAYTLDGRKQGSWSVNDAFNNSPYRDWLRLFEIDIPLLQKVKANDGSGRVLYDLIHLNSVQYLDAARAKALPKAQEGDLLISLRGINAIAVLRPSTRRIVWATLGPWRHQHDAKVDQDGKLYIYDNEGGREITLAPNNRPQEKLESRVIRYDPFTGLSETIFASRKLHSFWRGYYLPLPGGYGVISSSQESRVVVVSPEKKIIWELRGVPDRDMEPVPFRKQISTVRYYPAADLEFLKERGKP